MGFGYDTKALSAELSSNPSILSYTCGASAKLLVVHIMTQGTVARGGTAPTYNGTALSGGQKASGTYAEGCIESWYMLNPPTGSAYNISVPNTNAVTLQISASSYTATISPSFDKYASQVNGLGTPSVNIVTAYGAALLVGVCAHAYRNAPTAGAGYVQLQSVDAGAFGYCDEYDLDAGDAGTKTVNFVPGASDWYNIIAAAFYASVNTSTSVHAYMKGGIVVSTSKHAYIAGGGTPSTSVPAFMEGWSNVDSAIVAVGLWVGDIVMAIPAITSVQAYMKGKDTGVTSVPAYLQGCTAQVFTSKHAYMMGQIKTSVPAFIWGQIRVSTSKPAYIRGIGEFLYPDSDIVVGSFKRETGSSGSLFASINDQNDNTYVWYDNLASGSYFEVNLSDMTNTMVLEDGVHCITWRGYVKTGLGATVKMELRQTNTVIATDYQTLFQQLREFKKHLTPTEIAAISDYDLLRLRFTTVSRL